MAGDERDARLILRAEDRASQTFEQVAKSIKNVRDQIADQQKRMQSGTASVEEMNRSLAELKRLGDDLVRQQSLVNQFERLDKATANANDRLDLAKTKLATYQAEVDKSGTSTDRQANRLATLTQAVERAQQSYERQAGQLATVTSRLDAVGIATTKLSATNDRIVSSAREAAQGMSLLKTNIDSVETAALTAAAAQERLNQQQQFRAAAAVSPVGPAQIEFISRTENAVQRLRIAEEQLAVTAAKAAAEQRQLADLAAFRKIGTDAAAAAQDVSRFGTTVDSTQDNVSRLADVIRNNLGGTNASIQNLETAIRNVDDALALTADGATTKVNELQASAGKLAIAQATLVRTAEKIDAFRNQEQAVAAVEARFSSAQAEVSRLAAAMQAADAPVEALKLEMDRAETSMETLGREMQKERDSLARLSVALKQAGVDTKNLDNVQDQLTASSARAGVAAGNLQGKLKGKGAFLGLDPFALQNLSYQVNDVFTSLASGTPPLQVLAQQGGQIAQIFPGLISGALRFLPLIGLVVAAIGFMASAIGRAEERSQALKNAENILVQLGTQSVYTKDQLVEATDALQNMGATAEEARGLVKQFALDGLDPKQFDDFGAAAVNLATVTGETIPEAAAKMTTAFAEGKDGILSLDEETRFLSDTQRAQIESMDGTTQSAEIAEIAFDALYGKTQELADQMNGDSLRATNNLDNAWRNFLDTLGIGSPWEAIKGWINDVKNGLASLLNAISDVIDGLDRLGARRAKLRAEGGNAAVFKDIYDNGLFGGEIDAATKRREANTPVSDTTTRKRTSTGGPRIRRRRSGGGGGGGGTKPAKRSGGGRRSGGGGGGGRSVQDRTDQLESQLDNQLAQMEAKIEKFGTVPLESRLEAIDRQYAKVFENIDKFRKAGGKAVGDLPIDQYEAQVRANVTILKQQEEMKFYEQSINALLKERDERLKVVQDQYARGEITAQQASERTLEIISDTDSKVSTLAFNALAFAKALNAAKPSPELERYIERLSNVNADAISGANVRAAQTAAIATEEKKLNEILAARDAQVAAINNLVDLGVITQTQGQARVKEAYEAAQPSILAQLDVIDAMLQAFILANPAMQSFYDTWKARIEGIRASADPANAAFVKLKGQIDGLITQNAIEGINSIGDSLAGLITGAKSAGEAIGDIAKAFATFVLKVVQGIAQIIIEALILKAVDSLTGGLVTLVLEFHKATGLHTGGVVGQNATFYRNVPSAAFAGAPRYHSGGIAGFAPDEVPAVLRRGEEVLTESDPRHRANGGLGGGGGQPVRQVLAFNDEDLAGAMSGAAGEKVVVTHIKRNAATLKQYLAG